MERQCLNCGTNFQGRVDKKFCDDHCRGLYNYEHTPDNEQIVKKISAILRKNRKILKQLCPKEKATVSKTELLSRGFNFSYITSIHETGKNTRYQFCFEMGYLQISETIILIVLRDQYLKMHDQSKTPPIQSTGNEKSRS